uniref:Nucleolar protein 56 n=1 Tax=Oncorhynchus tshawytscha TaxID=74940 RepID=A0A8C8BS30_ONCTS
NSLVEGIAALFVFSHVTRHLALIKSSGVVHADLRLFLETNLPIGGKKAAMLGVGDAKIGGALQEELGLSIQTGGVVSDTERGASPLPLPDKGAGCQLGLGHSYSRAKVKFNVNRSDNMIIQSIALLDQLDKDINTFSMRVREWYGYHFPELIKIVTDNSTYCKMAQLIGNRKELSEESLEEEVMDSAKARAVLEASRSSMGMDISPIDLINIERFSNRVASLASYRLELQEYLRSKICQVAPNLATLIGDVVGAHLISHAGSLTNLAKYPASTVQILGAEKALFRALKTRGNTPKYGFVFHSTFIGRAAAKNKGRISCYLANKCTIASRIDTFSEVPTCVFGDKLRDQVEERLSFYETGEAPRKNLDAGEVAAEIKIRLEKREKKHRKREKKLAALSTGDEEVCIGLALSGN